MGKNHSEGKKSWWAKIPPEERSRIISERVKKGWDKKSKEEKRAKGLALVKAREGKIA